MLNNSNQNTDEYFSPDYNGEQSEYNPFVNQDELKSLVQQYDAQEPVDDELIEDVTDKLPTEDDSLLGLLLDGIANGLEYMTSWLNARLDERDTKVLKKLQIDTNTSLEELKIMESKRVNDIRMLDSLSVLVAFPMLAAPLLADREVLAQELRTIRRTIRKVEKANTLVEEHIVEA